MSDKEPAHVTVRILEKEYFVSCPQDERADLLDSAEFLNKKCARSVTPAKWSVRIASP